MRSNRLHRTTCVMLLLVSGAGALGEAPAVDVEKLESNWVAALLAANIHALEDMYSDDLI